MAQPEVDDFTTFPELDTFIDSLENKNGALIPALHKAQEIYGYLPKEVQLYIAQKLQMPASVVYGVVTFYSFFTMTKKGRYHIKICMGTACFVRGAGKVQEKFENDLNVKAGSTSEDLMFSVDALRCVGACGLAPVVIINEKVYGRVEEKDVKGIIDECLAEGVEA